MQVQLAEMTRVVERMTSPVALTSVDGTYVAVSEAYSRLLGVPCEGLVGVGFASVTYPDDVGRGLALVHRLASGESGHERTTKRYVRPDGAVVWVGLSVSAVRDAVGRVAALLAVALPADGETADQVSLRESEERFRLVFENSPVGMAVLGLEGECLRVNRSLCTMLGRRLADFGTLSLRDLLHPDDVPDAEGARRRILAGDIASLRIERRMVRGDGSVCWVQLTGSVVCDDAGQPVHFLVHFLELGPRDGGGAGAEQSPVLVDLVGGSDDVLLYRLRLDDLHFEYIGESVVRMMGYSAAEVYADPNLMFDIVHPDDAPKLLAVLAEPTAAPRALVLRWNHRDGREVVTRSQNAPLYEDGELVGLEGLLVDITGQWTAERAHERTQARFRSLVQNSTDALIVTDADGAITFVNPSVERILGWRHPAPPGARIWDFLHPDDEPTVRRLFPGAASGTSVRIRTRDGQWRWMEAFVTDLTDDPAVQGVVINARDIHSQRLAEDALRDRALTDPLTRLPNRTLLEDRVSRAVLRSREARTFTALFAVDVDDFAGINRTVGFEGADRVLIELAASLVAAAADTHSVARVAADEFAVCADGFPDRDSVREYAAALSTAVRAVEVPRVDVSASIGVAVSDGDGTAADLLVEAGAALAEAKRRGRGSIVEYDPEGAVQLQARPRWDRDLRGAAARDELRTLFQPIVDLHTGAVVGAEALLRWEHPTEGLIPPDEFIPAAERSGAIAALGEWVLRDACQAAARWRRRPALRGISVSVNLSGRQLGDRSLVELLDSTLRDNGLAPSSLTVEVTESAALAPGHLDVLRGVDALGVTVALDDFGTHYSSLSYLQRLPLGQLKIDRSFVSGIHEDRSRRAIVMATAQLAVGLGLRTVAEGIEQEREAAELRLFGVDCGQGYLFGRPMTAEALVDHVESQVATGPPYVAGR